MEMWKVRWSSLKVHKTQPNSYQCQTIELSVFGLTNFFIEFHLNSLEKRLNEKSEKSYLSEKKSDEKFVKTRAQWHENWNFTLAPVTCEQNQREMKRRKICTTSQSSMRKRRRVGNELKCRKTKNKKEKFLFHFSTIIHNSYRMKNTLRSSLSFIATHLGKCLLIFTREHTTCLMNWF